MNRISGSVLGNFSSVAMTGATTIRSGGIRILDYTGISVFVKWTGTPTGTLTIRATTSTADTPPDSSYEIVTGSTLAIAGAAGQNLYINNQAFFTHFQIVYVNSAGSGTITEAYFCGKES